MSRIAYVNGRYLPQARAALSVDDRAVQFSDSVYEVCLVLNGRLLDLAPHLDRLERSLAALEMAPPMSRRALVTVMTALLARNRLRHATLYLQVTRGAAPRDHAFPAPPPRPGLIMTVKRFDPVGLHRRQDRGIAVITTPDLRWRRCDIKSTSLLGNVLAKQAARTAGAFEGWMVDDAGFVTEGSSTTAWIVTADNRLVTRAPGSDILPGITRLVILSVAAEAGLTVEERAFSPDEARCAREAFTASTTAGAMPVTAIDGAPVGDGLPGPLTRRIVALHWEHVARETGYVASQWTA